MNVYILPYIHPMFALQHSIKFLTAVLEGAAGACPKFEVIRGQEILQSVVGADSWMPKVANHAPETAKNV